MNTITLTKEKESAPFLKAKETIMVEFNGEVIGRYTPLNAIYDEDELFLQHLGMKSLNIKNKDILSFEETEAHLNEIRNAKD